MNCVAMRQADTIDQDYFPENRSANASVLSLHHNRPELDLIKKNRNAIGVTTTGRSHI